jgi:three-Cys-motif partner protein
MLFFSTANFTEPTDCLANYFVPSSPSGNNVIAATMATQYDQIGIWSEVKLAIIKEYAAAYAKILDATRQRSIRSLKWLYIDAFAGPGMHRSKTTGDVVEGSPLIALKTKPAFSEYHFIDANPARAKQLKAIIGARDDVHIYSEDCNKILLRDVFPRAKYSDYRRALCLLDPYNINLKWEVIETAGKMKSIEVFLNFMIMDINRNALRRNRDSALQSKIDQLTALWGDSSWEDAAFSGKGNLFNTPEKVSNEEFELAWRERLKRKAGFKFVSKPMPMKTKNNSVIYYLYFASQKPVAASIVDDIFNKYRKMQGL